MSLSKDIYKAYTDSMGGENKLDNSAKKSLEELSEKLSTAFINFLTNQEFRIVEQEVPINIDTIRTTSDILANFTEDAKFGGTQADNFEKVVKIPKLNLKSTSGQGGSLDARGTLKYKQSNYKSANVPNAQSKKSTVKLFKGEIIDGK